jgi:predicted DsbA family dithiol-disulfide isomerase
LPFDLHPEYPAEGVTRASLARRYGPGFEEHTRRLITEAGFDYQPPARIPRSLRALQLGELARSEGCHHDVHRRLYRAYWSEGRDIGDVDVLVEFASAAGVDPDKARHVLESDSYAEEVRRSTTTAQRSGVTGVPAWVIDNKVLVPGAQPHEVFDDVLGQMGYEPLSGTSPGAPR